MNWKELLKTISNTPTPPRKVEKTNEEWARLLTPEQFKVTRLHGTERPFSGEYCELFTPGVYQCVCCGTELFDSTVKFDSRTGWPSFTAPVKNNVVRYISDNSYGMHRVEVLCNVCDAHLGHVFPDGPEPTGLRYCINSVSLKKEEMNAEAEVGPQPALQTATIGGGCFWCTEALMNELEGVTKVISGYSGGHLDNPTYRQITTGSTEHAEVVQVTFDPQKVSYADLLRIFFATHNPTSLNRQGADVGTQYRSIVLYHDEQQHKTVDDVISEMQTYFEKPIITEVVRYSKFFVAEQAHQDYYRNNPDKVYCQAVITPKLQKLRQKFSSMLKKPELQVSGER